MESALRPGLGARAPRGYLRGRLSRPAIPTWFFAIVIVRKGDRFLLVEERDGDWYLPAGRVEPGEGLRAGAIRETLEEAGVLVVLESIARIEHRPRADGARVRIFFVARPADDRPPKSVPDAESRGARWFTLAEARQLRLRGDDVLETLERAESGAPTAPLEILSDAS